MRIRPGLEAARTGWGPDNHQLGSGHRGDMQEARQLLRQAMELNPSDARAKALLDMPQAGPSTGREKE